MSEVSVTLNRGELDRMVNSTRGEVARDLHARGIALVQLARGQVGKNTGRLARSIGYDVSRSATGPVLTVTASARHALLHHEGTRPHYITAQSSRVLRFKAGGRVIYAQRVLHPGTRPNRYLVDNMRRVVT